MKQSFKLGDIVFFHNRPARIVYINDKSDIRTRYIQSTYLLHIYEKDFTGHNGNCGTDFYNDILDSFNYITENSLYWVMYNDLEKNEKSLLEILKEY